jgi:hypothetical protein
VELTGGGGGDRHEPVVLGLEPLVVLGHLGAEGLVERVLVKGVIFQPASVGRSSGRFTARKRGDVGISWLSSSQSVQPPARSSERAAGGPSLRVMARPLQRCAHLCRMILLLALMRSYAGALMSFGGQGSHHHMLPDSENPADLDVIPGSSHPSRNSGTPAVP